MSESHEWINNGSENHGTLVCQNKNVGYYALKAQITEFNYCPGCGTTISIQP